MDLYRYKVIGVPTVPAGFPAARHMTYTRCSTHADIIHTRLSLLCRKHGSANALNVCTSLPQLVTLHLILHAATTYTTLLAPHKHVFEHKTTHIEQRVLPAFAQALFLHAIAVNFCEQAYVGLITTQTIHRC